MLIIISFLIFLILVLWYVRRGKKPHHAGEQSDHFDGVRFYNQIQSISQKNLWQVFVWRVKGKRDLWPKTIVKANNHGLPRGNEKEIVVTFVNHATNLIQTGELNILTDPVYSDRTSPFRWIGPRRMHEPGVAYKDLPPIDVVLISHDHYDHMDEKTLKRLKKDHDPLFVIGLGNDVHLRTFGITEKVQTLDWWQSIQVGNSEITFVPSQHSSGRWLFDRSASLWGGFVIQVEKAKLYFAGDTGYGPHFQHIFDRFGPMDLSMIPIGAFEPRWFMKNMHINPEEAVLAHKDLRSKKSYGIHFKTFRLADESFEQPVIDLAAAREKHNVKPGQFIAPEFGESFRVLK